MSYATPLQMLEWFGSVELGSVTALDGYSVVRPALLSLTIQGGDRTAFSGEEIAAADAALARIMAALSSASSLIESYLGGRYTLPLEGGVVAASGLPRACGDLARGLLHPNKGTEETTRRSEAAIAWLRDVAKGSAVLGGVAAPGGQPVGAPEVSTRGRRMFDLQGF